MSDMQRNHFELLGLPQKFAIDTSLLDENYRKLQSEIHPDRFAAASAAERLRSMQWATRANEAYQTLKAPLPRARYLLHLQGVDTQEETNTAMPADFLMRQLEWRESIEEAQHAGDISALDQMLAALRREAAALTDSLRADLDELANPQRAAETVRKLRFLDKVREEIEQAISALEE